MNCVRGMVVFAALALVGLSSAETRGQPQKSAAGAPVKAADLALLVEIARARTLPAGADESSPDLAKIVSLVEAGKTKAALPLIAKYAKANKAHLDEAKAKQVASWVVRRALLLAHKDLHTTADRLRFAKEGKLALAKYEASLSGKAATDVAPAFTLNVYADGAQAVTVQKKKKKVSSIRKDLEAAVNALEAQDKLESFKIQNLSPSAYQAWMQALKNAIDAKGEIQKELARNM